MGRNITESALERLFGLPATTDADPLRSRAIPLLLGWQLAALTVSWAEQDRYPQPPRAFGALIDPDVITSADVVAGPAGDPIRELLAARARDLAAYEQTLRSLHSGAGNPGQGLVAMLAHVMPSADLTDWDQHEQCGEDIAALLESVGLRPSGFGLLRSLASLTMAANPSNDDWSDAVAVLVGVYKRSLFPFWATQDAAFVLGPDYFAVSEVTTQVDPYRVDEGARQDWQSVLHRRVAQRAQLIEANARAVAAAERSALPVLRDALLASLGDPNDPAAVSVRLSNLLRVEIRAGATGRTTRVRQAIESIQSLLCAKRSGELLPDHPAYSWRLVDADAFNAAWVWMGRHLTWRAATVAFLFPNATSTRLCWCRPAPNS